ncbi:MAG: electron transfer flavoprotein subunit beta/FixA family protein [Anaerolineae bacterium]|nr:electron transfer flavoprotein subunit beta/FixA family protein [Anaerolineae bacterium]MDW8173625.1 electron transfer flavoprotein subunit beta/FixA family protein [Anaerolineae bacterium]
MRIVTFTRSTPDTATKVEVDAKGHVGWGDVATVVNPWDEYSLEETIRQAEANKATSAVLAIGPDMHNEALKHSLAMGLQEAYRIWQDGLDVSDSLAWATLAAAAVHKLGDVRMVIFGKESVDTASDQHAYQTARKLGWTMLSYVSKILAVDLAAGTIKVEKLLEEGKQVITAKLPAVLTVMKGINEPRYPNFMGIRKASKAVIPVWSAADLGVSLPPASTQVVAFMNPPARQVITEIIDGANAQEKAAKLVEKLLEAKVL